MQVIIVGSGAGGATVAKELSADGMAVALIEKGPFVDKKTPLVTIQISARK